ncbi:hypothetical protein JRQ81_003271 [Phrynocephalus forsythii]|uniref:acylglycerol lipase n=1 Tax=Phrynocephalus forsythii TaxID=171643 RepID=A0A9Q0XJJ6_9SAUR|nr:hypothetical protein JRQ81_003271 [Phrynocephalus forsythii]
MDLLLLKIFLMHLSILVASPWIIIAALYFFSPATLITFGIRFLLWKYGLEERCTEHEGYRFCYFTYGKPSAKPSILLLHGFSLRKESWLMMMKYFPKGTHVVCVDMPGHGKTSCLPGDSYNALDQAKRIHQFVECIGLNRQPFHLVGISMGGMIAGIYAAQYPSDLCALSLLCPAGLRYPVDNDFIKKIKELEKEQKLETENPLIPLTTKEAVGFLKLCAYSFLPMPHQVKIACFFNYIFIAGFLDLFSEENRFTLHDKMSKISAPTLVLWGKNDNVLDPSGAEILAKAIPDTQWHVLEKCGHLITVDLPVKSMGLLLDFHNSISMKMCKKVL